MVQHGISEAQDKTMKKIIFTLLLSLTYIGLYAQCTGLGTGTNKSKATKVCYDTVTVKSTLNTLDADTCTFTKITVTAPIIGSMTGNAATATALQTPRTINGTSFDGTANITVTAAAGTLTGGTLANGITASSLTSFGSSPTLVTPLLGTPTSGVLSNCTGLPLGSITELGSGIATWWTTPSSANLAAAITDETGSGSAVFATSPTLVTPLLGTPTSGVLTNTTGYLVQNIATSNISAASWTTSGVKLKLPPIRLTNTSSSGTVALIYNNLFSRDTMYATSSTTYTNAYNLFVDDLVAGTNVAFGGRYALGVGGAMDVTGNINLNGGARNIGTRDANILNINTNGANRISLSSAGLQTHTHTTAASGTTPFVTYTQVANTGGSAGGLLWTGAAHTSQTTATEVTDINFDNSAVLKSVDGTIPTMRAIRMQARTYTPQTTALTISDCSTLEVNTPVAGSGTTLTAFQAIKSVGNIALLGNLNMSGATRAIGNTDANVLNFKTTNATRQSIGPNGDQTFTMATLASGGTMFTITQPNHTTATTGLLYTGGAITAQTAATEYTDVNINTSSIVKFVDGTVPTQRTFRIQGHTYTPVTSALTITDAVNVEIGSLTAGSGTTFTRNWNTRFVGSGNVGIGGNLYVGDATVTTAPTSTIQVAGSVSLSYVAKTTTYSITATDYVIDCISGTFTATLPTAVSITGRIYVIKNSGAGTITLATTSSQTIDGSTTKTLNTQYATMTVQSNGSNWIILTTF